MLSTSGRDFRSIGENVSRRTLRRKEVWTMWILILEAFGAAALLVFIVWWTMFSGRRHGERVDRDDE